jgi:hypothetical protein
VVAVKWEAGRGPGVASLNLSVEHGQTWEVARTNFEKGITEAVAQFGRWIQRFDWSEDRTAARLSGSGYEVDLRVDDRRVHATGHIPFPFRMFEGPARRFIEETIRRPAIGG